MLLSAMPGFSSKNIAFAYSTAKIILTSYYQSPPCVVFYCLMSWILGLVSVPLSMAGLHPPVPSYPILLSTSVNLPVYGQAPCLCVHDLCELGDSVPVHQKADENSLG
jgi:hypothetical protein